jgi:Bor protein
MDRHAGLALLLLTLPLGACYHATIDAGAKPSTVTVEKRWASGWIFGLVPPKTVETASRCATGVSKVETQVSFLNGLVGFLTLSIYTPMDIRVTCAEAVSEGTALLVPDSASAATWQSAIAQAAAGSHETGQPVYLRTLH